MSENNKKQRSKPFPITLLLSISIAVSISAGAVAAEQTGVLDNLFNVNVTDAQTVNNVLISDYVIGEDNKNYSILVSSTKSNITSINGTINGYNILILPKVVSPPPEEPPVPPIPPTGKTYRIVMLGDVDNTNGGTNVFNAIKNRNPDIVAVLGDLGYDSNLNWFKSTYGTLGNKLVCMPGNHDAPEDGSSSIYTETKNFCSNPFYFKQNKVLFVGVDTNGDLTSQASTVGKLFTNPFFMKNISSIHIMSHKPCAVPPNSHHPVESNVKTFCDSITGKVPTGVKIFFDQAHNHIMSASGDGKFKQSGAGGKSHYTCPTDPSIAYPFCNDSDYGFLEYTIKPDGTTSYQFVDYNGRVLYSK